jgi:tetratricopeptide (TPR) repeat protein
VVDRLTRLYSGDQGTGLLSALQPDLLGQYAVASFLSRCDRGETEFGGVRSFLERLLAGADEAALASTLTIVGRIAAGAERDAGCRWLRDMLSDHLEERIPVAMRVAIELGNGATPSPVERVLIEALEQDGTPQLAERISALCPEQTLSLAEIKAVAKDIIVTHIKSLPDVQSEEGRARLAKEQANYGVALSHLGKREAALAATQEAVEIYRTLAAERPDAFLPYLATSLNNLGGTLTHLGKREAALAVTQEAVAIRRTLAAARPEAALADLALSLSSMGAALTQLGKREAALAATQEAVEIYRALAARRPNVFLPALAGALDNLGISLVEVGNGEAALAATEEGTEIRRTLATAHPDAFLPALAGSLNNLGNLLKEVGKPEAALAATQQSVEVYRRLAAARPDAFLPELAGALNNLGNRFGAVGKWEAALIAIKEAVELSRSLAAEHPDAFLPDLALYLLLSCKKAGCSDRESLAGRA